VAALDPFRGYERALRVGLPAATVVVDAFQPARLAQDAVDQVRRRVQQQTHGHRGRAGDPLYRIRRILLRGAENLTPKAYARMLAGLDAGDPNGEVAAAYIACRQLRHLYTAPDLARARARLYTFYQACAARRARTRAARTDHQRLGTAGAGLLHHRRRLQRTDRGG
jgi:hypothetical protein